MASNRETMPLIYSCSGASSVAQLTNWVAVQVDRRELAEMSCIAGVGGDVPQLVKKSTSGRPIIALDGCHLACVRNSLARHRIMPDVYWQLGNQGIKKRLHTDFDPEQAARVLEEVSAEIVARYPAGTQDPSEALPS